MVLVLHHSIAAGEIQMKTLSKLKSTTGVKVFINTVFVLGLVPGAFAAESSRSQAQICESAHGGGSDEYFKCLEKSKGTNQIDCNSVRREVADAVKSIGEACRKGGLGEANACIEKANECADDMGLDDFQTNPAGDIALNTIGQMTGLGNLSGITKTSASGCPQLGGKDYFEQKKDLDQRIKDLKEEMAETTKEAGEIKDTFNKDIAQMQKDINETQKELDEKIAQRKIDKRDQLNEFQRNQAQLKEQQGTFGLQLIKLRNDLNQSQLEQAQQLIALSDQAGKSDCMRQVEEMNSKYKTIATSTARNFMSQASTKKKELINAYNSCIGIFHKKRIALNQSKQSEQQSIQKQIESAQSSVDNVTTQLTTSSDQLAQMEAEAVEQENKDKQEVLKKMQITQQEMTAAQTKMTSDLQANAQKAASQKEALNRAQQDLADLSVGGKPKRGTEYSVSDTHSDISTYTNQIQNIVDDPEIEKACGYLGQNVPGLKKRSSSRSSRGSSKTRTSQ